MSLELVPILLYTNTKKVRGMQCELYLFKQHFA